jgi:hypothetical protein
MSFINISSLNGLRFISEGLSGKGQLGRQTQRLINLAMAEFQSGGSGSSLNVADVDPESFRNEVRYGKNVIPAETSKLFDIMLDYIKMPSITDDTGAYDGVQPGNQQFESFNDVKNSVQKKAETDPLRATSNTVGGGEMKIVQKEQALVPGSEAVYLSFVDSLIAGVEEASRGEGEMSEELDPDDWHGHVQLVNRNKSSVIPLLRTVRSTYQRGQSAQSQMRRVLNWFDRYIPDFGRKGGFEDVWFDLGGLNRSNASMTDLYSVVF